MHALSRAVVFALIVAATSCAHRPPMAIQPVRSPCQQVVPDRAHPVVWIAPEDARDLERLGRWCQTVGPVVVESPPADDAPAIADRLAIITWNVHVGGGDLEALIGALRTGEMTGGTAPPEFVLLLQEAYREGHDVPSRFPAGSPLPRPITGRPPSGMRRDIRVVAAHVGLHLFYAPAMRNSRGDTTASPEDRGTAILSTLPLADLQVIELPFERQRRVALAASVAGRTSASAAWQLRLANVQFDTTLAATRGGPIAARRRQAEALLDALTERSAPFMVLGGDFNTWLGSKEPAVELMRRAFPDTPRAADVATWRGPFGTRAALDHVFVRGPFRDVATRRLAGRFGSDHYPLLTLVEFQ